jgi:hypothetical protein
MNKKILLTLILVLGLLIVLNIYSAAILLLAKPAPSAKVKFCVADIADNTPVGGAKVYIPQVNAYFETDETGSTPVIEVPVLPDGYYDNIYKRSFGEITAIVYKEGYIDYILLNLCVRENEQRLSIKLFMYKKGTSDREFISIVETPDESWVKGMIDKYRK